MTFGNVKSSLDNIACGVQQGPMLGSILSTIYYYYYNYINYICNVSNILTFVLFADDTNMLTSNKDITNYKVKEIEN